MNIIICGAGRVGFTIAKILSEQGHSITIIDQSSDDIQKIDDTLDVKSIVGKGTYPSILEKANAADADMIIAVTRNDEINIAPLKNRISDIPLLVDYFSEKISTNYNLKKLSIDTNSDYLINYDWPGNVRELRNLIERIAILSPDSADKISNIIKESLKTPDIKNIQSENSLSIPLKEARENFEKEYLTTQLKKFNGNISKTADFIGMERSALHRKLKGLGIKVLN